VRDPGVWRRVGVRRVRWTGAYWCLSELEPPSEVRLLATPCRSELGPGKGSVAGRQELFRTPYSHLEHTVRDQLVRLLGPGGFDPARDIEAITVDRWGHGRAPEYCRPWHPFYPDGPFPADAARGRFGRIAIAGSDSEPGPDGAVTAAVRAVGELARP
jgi:spermidine dehydrogenase